MDHTIYEILKCLLDNADEIKSPADVPKIIAANFGEQTAAEFAAMTWPDFFSRLTIGATLDLARHAKAVAAFGS